jgi:hypothetical protein
MHLLDPVQCHQSIRDWLKLYPKQSGTASISNGSQGMRFVEIADRHAIFRKERLTEIFPNAILHEISGTNLRGLSQVEEAYEAILVSVDDIQRLRFALNPCGKLLINNKISFAYTSSASCLERARLLRMGFDDVFTNKMMQEEVLLRIESIKRRYSDIKIELENEAQVKNFLSGFSLRPLCGQQFSIFYNLIKNCGKVLRYNDLASYDFLEATYRLESLRVNISQMRKILRGCEIIGIPNEGYLLNVTESGNLEKKAS